MEERSLINITETNMVEGVKDLAVDFAEVGLDQALNDGLLREIPVLGSIVGVMKLGIYVKDFLLQRSIERFRFQLDIPEDKKQKFMVKLRDDDDFRQRVGENLLLLLNRVDDIRKPKFIANVFEAFVEGRIDDMTYQKLSFAIDRVHIYNLPDLVNFYASEEPDLLQDDVLQDLAISGLVNIISGSGWQIRANAGSTKNVKKNSLGKLFVEIALNENE